MPGTPNSSVKPNNTKPINVFYIWYTELCRRSNSNPIVITRIGKSRCNTVLDFVADRLKFEDWSPLINALRHDTSLHVINIRNRMANYQFLHDVDTEDKARRTKRKYGFIWTDYVLNSLVKALSYSLRKTQVLTCLELDGLPLYNLYLDGLLKALKENSTLKNLSLANCPIEDEGCRSVCLCLQLIPNVESLNLTKCELSSISGKYIAKLIKFQQLNRYTTSWHKSLRYAEPDTETMRGMRRITLNRNIKLGDVGLGYILDELEDDLWIKALDMQKCGITENIAPKLLDILNHNQSLQIADFRQNEALNPVTLEKVLDLLKEKTTDSDCSFQWCNTVLSLCPSSNPCTSRENSSSLTNRTPSFPSNKINGMLKGGRTTTVDIIKKTTNGCVENTRATDLTKGKRIHLNLEIKHDVVRKKDVKNPNDNICKLPSRIKNMNGINGLHAVNGVNGLGDRVMNTLKSLQSSNDRTIPKDLPNNTSNDTPLGNRNSSKCSKGINVFLNGVTNGYKIVQNQKLNASNSASNIFQKIFGATEGNEISESSSGDEDDLKSFCDNYEIDLSEIRKNSNHYLKRNEISGSQISLFEYMEEYDDKNAEIPSDPKILTSKHHYKGKKNGIK